MEAIEFFFAFDYYQYWWWDNQLNYRITNFFGKNNFVFRYLLSMAFNEWEWKFSKKIWWEFEEANNTCKIWLFKYGIHNFHVFTNFPCKLNYVGFASIYTFRRWLHCHLQIHNVSKIIENYASQIYNDKITLYFSTNFSWEFSSWKKISHWNINFIKLINIMLILMNLMWLDVKYWEVIDRGF
jgi:hypothetical protein